MRTSITLAIILAAEHFGKLGSPLVFAAFAFALACAAVADLKEATHS